MLTQNNRIGRLTTPLGPDVLCLVELHAREGLSELFDFDLVAVSEDADIDIDALIRSPARSISTPTARASAGFTGC